jgi:hypothetical protein
LEALKEMAVKNKLSSSYYESVSEENPLPKPRQLLLEAENASKRKRTFEFVS